MKVIHITHESSRHEDGVLEDEVTTIEVRNVVVDLRDISSQQEAQETGKCLPSIAYCDNLAICNYRNEMSMWAKIALENSEDTLKVIHVGFPKETMVSTAHMTK